VAGDTTVNTRLLHVEPEVLVTRSVLSRTAIRMLRMVLRSAGKVAYYLGFARAIIDLSPNRVRTLLYHAVEDEPGSYTAGLGMSVSPRTFRKQLDFYRHYYNVVSMQDIVNGTAGPRAVVITFDDGYTSVGQYAVPALEERGLPATVYLIGKALRGEMVWVNLVNHALNRYPKAAMAIVQTYPGLAGIAPRDVIQYIQSHFTPLTIEQLVSRLEEALPLNHARHKLFLSREDVQSLKSRGISFGFHTNDHYNLRQCNEYVLTQQLDSSEFDDLLDSHTFAYPFGFCGDREADKLDSLGFERVMLVRDDPPHPRTSNMKRFEPINESAASMFAKLEVEEPVMQWLKSAA
jgi:peptidoglycan/xylan/chitin deacetylase (PgdA/CDA1 family)